MKRIVISILFGAAFVFGYFFSLAILYQVFPVSFDTLAILLLPINLPYDIYKRFFGLYYGNPTVVKTLNFAVGALIYSIPFYLALTLLAKMKKKSKVEGKEIPPEPPAFES